MLEEDNTIREISFSDLAVFVRKKRRKKKEEWTHDEMVLHESRANQQLAAAERQRIAFFRTRHDAALVIQRAWKLFKFKTKGVLKNARDAVRLKRLDAGEQEWKKQIAACTIQLAWRKYARRKLLNRLKHSASKVLRTWEPNMIALKQQKLMEIIYTEELYAPAWHPILQAVYRPFYMTTKPSPAILSYNFAINQYKQSLLCDLLNYPPSDDDFYNNSRIMSLQRSKKTTGLGSIRELQEDEETTSYPRPIHYSYNIK